MLHAVEASIPVCPFEPTSIPAYIDCCEPAYIQLARPAKKGVAFDALRTVSPANRAERSSPPLEIQERRALNTVALKHCRLRFGARRSGAGLKPATGSLLRSGLGQCQRREECGSRFLIRSMLSSYEA